MGTRKTILSILGVAALAGAGWLVYTADKEGVIDVAWMWGFDGYVNYNPPKATESNLAELRERTLSDMIHIPGGSFMMGDYELDVELLDGTMSRGWIHTAENFYPAHKVTLDSYYISRFKATNYDFDLYSDANGLPLLPPGSRRGPAPYREGPHSTRVTKPQAEAFCNWLGDITGQRITLPTEAQWEYAARSRGLNAPYATNTGTALPGINIPDTRRRERANGYGPYLYPPTRFPPNPLGIYDMSIRYREWVSDWYSEDYYLNSPEHNPQGPERTGAYIRRGGDDAESLPGSTTTARMADSLVSEENFSKEELETLQKLGITDGTAAIRCAVQLSAPPSVSGFGRDAGEIPDNYPALLIQIDSLQAQKSGWNPKIPPGWKLVDGKLVSVPIE